MLNDKHKEKIIAEWNSLIGITDEESIELNKVFDNGELAIFEDEPENCAPTNYLVVQYFDPGEGVWSMTHMFDGDVRVIKKM